MDTCQRWGVSRTGRWGGLIPLAVFLALGCALALQGARTSDRLGGCAFLVLAPLGYWLLAVRPYVEVGPSGMVVRNPFRYWAVPLDEIENVESGYSGLVIQLANGRTLTAWAVQQSNVGAWIGGRGRAAEVRSVLGMLRHQ